jgi:hypothetical protein
VRVIALPGFPPVIVGVAQQFLAEVELEASVVKRSTKFATSARSSEKGDS